MRNLFEIDEFGAIDAESDSQLIDCFYRARIIDDLLEGKKSNGIASFACSLLQMYLYNAVFPVPFRPITIDFFPSNKSSIILAL